MNKFILWLRNSDAVEITCDLAQFIAAAFLWVLVMVLLALGIVFLWKVLVFVIFHPLVGT